MLRGEVHALNATDIATDRLLRYGVLREAEKTGWKILQKFLSQASEFDVNVITDVRGNLPESCLIDYAKEKNINLIVLGTKREYWGLDMFFGSVVERITSLAHCPILIAKKKSE